MKKLFLIILISLLGWKAQAQSFSSSTSGNFDIYSVLSLTFTNLTGVVSFNTPNDYFNGITVNNSATIAVKSNVSWQVSVATQSSTFTPMSMGASTDMPSSILAIRRNGNTTFTPMTTNSQTLKTGNRGPATTSGNTFDIDTRIDPGFSYSGGNYNIGVIYTLTQQ